MSTTILKLGWTNPLTDTFGAHPTLGGPLDLNDGQTFALVSPEGLELAPPPRTLLPVGNIRSQGERVARAVYRHNREAICHVLLGPMSSYSALTAQVRTLVQWLNAPPQVPITIQYQPPGASAPVYLDVVGAGHDLPTDEASWLRLALEPIELVFICRPGLRGDRVTLSNLIANPGFGQGSGPGVVVFDDPFANVNAYSNSPGSGTNLMFLAPNTVYQFGSPSWGAINDWQVRWQWSTGQQMEFHLHFVDLNHDLYCAVQGTAIFLIQVAGGVSHTLATTTFASLTNAAFYWIVLTQFPTVPGDPPDVQATLYQDNAGAVGTQIVTLGPVPTFDATSALSGQPAFRSGSASGTVGGAFPGVHRLALFGPGGWASVSLAGAAPSPAPAATCVGALGWDAATVYSGGPVVGQASARMDGVPAGIWHAQWVTGYAAAASGSSPAGLWSPPALGLSAYVAGAWAYAPAVSATCVQRLLAKEYDAGGATLATTVLASHTGPLASWTQLSGTWTTQATTAIVQLVLDVYDSVAGASAGQAVWWANTQMQAGAGPGLGPYCELRFPQSPAQLLISGLQGDLPAPALLQMGTYLGTNGTTGILPGDFLSYIVGRRGGQGQVSGTAGALFVAPAVGFYGTTFTPQASAVLDPTSYGGYYVRATVGTGGWNPRGFSPRTGEALGTYHVLGRYRTQDPTPAGVQVRAKMEQLLAPWYTAENTLGMLGTYYGPYANPLSSAGVWTIADAGQVQIPFAPLGALSDPMQTYVVPRGEWVGTTAGGSEGDAGWMALVPVDGSLVMGVVNDPTNNAVPSGVVSTWLWVYGDGLLVNRAGVGDGPGWGYSLESGAIPQPGHGGGGPGMLTPGTGPVNINRSGDPYLTLDPAQIVAGQGAAGQGVNQVVAYIADQAGSVLPFYAEVLYSPLYLWPR